MEGKIFECAGFTFFSNFDSANLARVELVPKKSSVQSEPKSKTSKKPNINKYHAKKSKGIELPDYEFNMWTNPDCAGTEFENSNRTWFHFGITGGTVYSLLKLNIIDLNKQSKMYSQGMAPVYKIVPGKCQWERIRDKPVFTSENNVFTISFKFMTTDNVRAVTYFAFTYPFSFSDLQTYLGTIDLRMSNPENHLPKSEIRFNKGLKILNDISDAIYYHRETLCYSIENRKIDLITISSHHNITAERDTRLDKLFPDEHIPRSFRFQDKKVVFISARVHPGETPSSFVMNGILNLLTQKDDPIAILLRRQFVFKLIPMLNPDGVARGHYRTDTRGCNLNRFYLKPSREFHPSIFGARALIRYHHFGEEVPEDFKLEKSDVSSQVDPNELSESEYSSAEVESPKLVCEEQNDSLATPKVQPIKTILSLDLYDNNAQKSSTDVSVQRSDESIINKDEIPLLKDLGDEVGLLKEFLLRCEETKVKSPSESVRKGTPSKDFEKPSSVDSQKKESGLFLYVDMHGHASKKGVFMYGNYFNRVEDSVECMLFPKIMSINSQNFHFSACNFSEKNMYLRDKRDGTSREGSGRVAVLRLTGLIRSYTLECNYNTGRFVNKLPQCCRDLPGKNINNLVVPPKYSPIVYEEIGKSLCVSLLDMTNTNPWSRIPNSEFHTVFGMRDWLRLKTLSDNFLYHRPLTSSYLKRQPNKSSQTQVMMGVLRSEIRPGKLLPQVLLPPIHSKQSINEVNRNSEDLEKKENITLFRGASCNSVTLNRKEAGSSHTVKPLTRVSSVVQVRGGSGGGARTKKSSKKSMYRAGEKIPKFKAFIQKPEGVSGEEGFGEGDVKASHSESDRIQKLSAVSDQCLFKQSPKRLKTGKDDVSKIKVLEWSKEDALPGTSSSDIVTYSKLNRSGSGDVKKRISGKSKQQLSPMKFKKSIEKRRGSDASRKKSKTLFKKAGKIILTNDLSKSSIERKRRKK